MLRNVEEGRFVDFYNKYKDRKNKDKKICPLMSCNFMNQGYVYCVEERCALYDKALKVCSLCLKR